MSEGKLSKPIKWRTYESIKRDFLKKGASSTKAAIPKTIVLGAIASEQDLNEEDSLRVGRPRVSGCSKLRSAVDRDT